MAVSDDSYDVTTDPSSPYYLGPMSNEAKSGDEIRAEVTAEVDAEIADAEHWLAKLILPLIRDEVIQQRYAQRIDEARDGLDEGLELRADGGPPRTVWDNAAHEQMVEAISRDADSAVIAESSEEWVRLGNELTEHQRALAASINDSMGNWEGEGGDAARTHLTEVGRWLGATASGATLAGRQQQIHSQALNETQKRMTANPPVPFSAQEANARLQTISDPVQFALQAQQDMQTFQVQQSAREQAARIMNQFDETVGSAATMPVFAAPPTLAFAMSATQTAGGGAAAGARFGEVRPGTEAPPASMDAESAARGQALRLGERADATANPVGTAAPGTSSLAASATPGAGAPVVPDSSLRFAEATGATGERGSATPPVTPGPLPEFDSSTRAAGFTPHGSPGGVPAATTAGQEFSHRGTQFTGQPQGTTASGVPAFGGPGVPTGSDTGRGRGPSIGRSGGINGDSIASRLGGLPGTASRGGDRDSQAPGDTRRGGGSPSTAAMGGIPGGATAGRSLGGIGGGSGAGGAALGSAGGTPGQGVGTGSVSGTGDPSGGRGGSGPAAGAGAGAGAARGVGGMPMGAGAGRGKSEEDKEYRVAEYLEPEDPAIFAADEVVAPPVIGDWKNKDWK
ncbi:hypothetical protein SAMN05216266_1014 [Amycolatopsis marina]|uniref:PPE family protein n=1 Tax=Amycolatopsis marina TaxID=490629 RepID=A0A1I0V4Z0_9PSEU|nr:hypothetical protein [Amycolatopsis marina]SFA71332.1 hypothetical protein SAMN05216266_1014 [Amycolatopsis marina]